MATDNASRSPLSRVRSLLRHVRAMARDPYAERIEALRHSGLFDPQAYLASYPDVATSGLDPLRHYVERGAAEGRRPCAYFDPAWYRSQYPDVVAAGMDPFEHYVHFGWKERRHPSAEFDARWYAEAWLGDAGADVDPLRHYLDEGRMRGVQPRPVADPHAEAIRESGLFDAEHYLATYEDVAASGTDPLRHYVEYGASEGRSPSPWFNPRYYLKHNPDVARAGIDPLLHFIHGGWKELRNPHPDFDIWWYWTRYLDPASEETNPLAHFLAVGLADGLQPRPPRHVVQGAGAGWRHPQGKPVRRICLFAAYDPDGIVDPCVVDYLRELSRHADIHYLADCDMREGELDKIAPYVRSAAACRHGEYDFGSYSRLARQIGWDTIGGYDELILANDSCYLLRSLDHVFAKMDAKPCDWWGMQATKGIAATRKIARNRFTQPIPMSTVRFSMLSDFEADYRYDFHVGTYFVAFRKPVLEEAGFRRLLESVVAQSSKLGIVLKYEVGLTRMLIALGYAFDTFSDFLYPFHPVYSNWYFQLLDEGFPFLKRYLLSENHHRVQRLGSWAERIRRKVPDADIDAIRANLERLVAPERLEANFTIGQRAVAGDAPLHDTLLDDTAFQAADQAAPKHANWWAFPACAFTRTLAGNERAVFEAVKHDPTIKKVVLTRGLDVSVEGENVEIVPLESPRGQYLLMRCGNIFVKHSPTRNLVYPVVPELHNLINLWHGIPFKRIGYASLDMQDRPLAVAVEHAKCRAVISSSKVDTLAMAAAFYPLAYQDIWLTGLPRNDFILRDFDRLPTDLRREEQVLRDRLNGKRLVLFMPTFRNDQEQAGYRFKADEIAWLADWLQRSGAVLGLREHMADTGRVYARALADLAPLDLSDGHFPNVEILYRCSSMLVTDYSSTFIDYMLTGKPAVSFAYDYDSYSRIERGAFYDLDMVFPGPVCGTFGELSAALDRAFLPKSDAEAALFEHKRRLFFEYIDDANAARLVREVKKLMDFDEIGSRHYSEFGEAR